MISMRKCFWVYVESSNESTGRNNGFIEFFCDSINIVSENVVKCCDIVAQFSITLFHATKLQAFVHGSRTSRRKSINIVTDNIVKCCDNVAPFSDTLFHATLI